VLEFNFTETTTIKMMELRFSNDFYSFVERNKEYLINWIPFVSKIKGINDIENYVKKYLDRYANGIGALYGLWENNELIGSVLIREMDQEAKWAEIGYMIDQKYQGKGIIKRACIKLIDYIFNDLGMEKVEICCDENNESSSKLAESLGFKLEGTIRNHVMVNNKIGNMKYYGLLRIERKN
jgi:ribosomal-protein-serine acetyltransferase